MIIVLKPEADQGKVKELIGMLEREYNLEVQRMDGVN